MSLAKSDLLQRLRKRVSLASQQGSMLIEVMVGAIVLAFATAAVLDGLDGAQDTGRRNKDRSVSSTLAQQDLERLRSWPISALSNLRQTRTVTMAGVDYSVASQTDWMRDASGVVSCTDNTAQTEYLRVSSTVRSPVDKDAPVTETTLLAPPPGGYASTGTAAVRLQDRDGGPLAGVRIELSGPQTATATTNDLGCAIFAFMRPGDYHAEVQADLVGQDGIQPPTGTVTVSPAKTSLLALELDRPASLNAFFKTPSGATTSWNTIGVSHQSLTTPRFFSSEDGSKVSPLEATKLFPHHTPYGIFAGSCETNNPEFWTAGYYDTGPGSVQLEPGVDHQAVTVVMPVLKVKVTRSATTKPARVLVITTDQTNDVPPVACTTQVVQEANNTGHTVDTFVYPVPFGHYRVCVDDWKTGQSTGSTNRRQTATTNNPANANLTTAPAAEVLLDLNISNGSASGVTHGKCW